MSSSTAAFAAAAAASSPFRVLSPNPNTTPRRFGGRFPGNGSAARVDKLWLYRRGTQVPRLSGSLDLPLLPFDSREVLVPSECKTLHLYEARFLALLEESLLKKGNLFVHIVLDPVLSGRSSKGSSFAARYGCLVHIENVERMNIGALVSIRGIGRVSILEVLQMEPFLRGTVIPKQDSNADTESEIDSKLLELRGSLHNLQSLQIKLKASKDEQLQTRIKNSLSWAEREDYEDLDQAFIPKLAERISFAALQPVSGSSSSELFALQRAKLQAMDYRDTVQRLSDGIVLIKQSIAIIAAKLAIQSVEI